ncbi:MAG TPA: efflux RND transporter periplasmic adaptor subunit [Gemmataceae bacterium]
MLLSLVLLLGCGRSPPPPPQASEEKATPTVRIVRPERAAIHREVSQPGAIQAFEETPIFAKIAGYIKEWKVDIDATVRKDQLLAELSVPELEVERQQKEALIRQADEQVEQAQKAATAAEAAFHTAEAQIKEAEAGQDRAEADVKRTRSQSERLARAGQGGVLDRESVEETRLGYEAALAALRQAKARVQTAHALRNEGKAKWDKARTDVRVAEASAGVARKNGDYVQTQLDYTRLTAPYDGVVTQRHVNTGDFVRAATSSKEGPLYVVRRTDLLRIFVQVPESDTDWVRKGVAARIRVPKLSGQTFNGTVARTSWAVDPDTRTLRAEIDLANPDGRLRPGLYVHATLSAELADVLTLPHSAVATEGEVTRGYHSYCYQVKDGEARRLPLELGVRDNARVEVLKKQPRPGGSWESVTGEEEIVQNVKDVRDGQRVRVDR